MDNKKKLTVTERKYKLKYSIEHSKDQLRELFEPVKKQPKKNQTDSILKYNPDI